MGAMLMDEIDSDADACDGLLCLGDAAKVLDLSERTVRRMFDDGTLRGRKSNGRHRYIYISSLRSHIGTDFILTRKLEKVLKRLGKIP